MVTVIGVRFRTAGKIYYFSPGKLEIKNGDHVIVETARGIEYGHVVLGNRDVEDNKVVQPLKAVIRMANKEDIAREDANRKKEKDAFKICQEKIRKHKLEMKLVDAEYTIDGSKVIFYFSAEGRIDFRELVKDLAAHFRMRIELRQIGVRDEARMLGGIGICGRPFCCSRWLHDFQPVSIKMAKQQNLSLNPSKISGSCGRLMCCLNFENKTYQELRKGMPNEGEQVVTPDGPGKVTAVNLFEGSVNVRLFEKSKDKDAKETPLSQEVRTYFKQEVRRTDKKSHKKSRNEQNNVDPETMKELEKLTRD